MKNSSFRAIQEHDIYSVFSCNRVSDEQSLMVNCAGITATPFCFSTDSKGKRKDYYLMYLTDGELTFHFPNEEKNLTAGTAVIFPPEYHYVYSHSASSDICYYYVHFTGRDAKSILANYGLTEFPIVESIGISQRTIYYFEQLFSVLSRKELFFEQESALKLGSILLHLAKRISKSLAKPTETPLSKSVEYMHTSFQEEISLEMLANLENLSVSRFCTLFKTTFGVSPIQYLITIRIENACELLKNTDISIQNCALSCGYANEYFFGRQFKKQTGITPAKFRNQFN